MDNEFVPTVPMISPPDILKAFLKPGIEFLARFSGPEYTNVNIQVEQLVLETDMTTPHQVIFLSDLHSGTEKHSDEGALVNIFSLVKDCAENSLTPDNKIVLLGGDLVNKPFAPYDYGSSLSTFSTLLNSLSDCVSRGLEVVAVEGNHDIENPDWFRFYRPRILETGIKILSPFETYHFGETAVIGLPDISQPDYQVWHRNYLPFMRTLVPTEAKQLIYLFHNPDSIPYILKYFSLGIRSLLLSGHSHLTGFDREKGRIARGLGNLALKGVPIHHQEYVNPKLSLNEGEFFSINSSGVAIHPFHLIRRNVPKIHNIQLTPTE
ncbi:metallophosphoesterase [Candidatus Dojkabacteria bacterium]|uniref:Metallophosphoesterase n=1 Tax=Candidatus Dojkabacteria bacterium TaxID=2099670 RepID=A0A955IA22_9BACT|nr:metallophosphoesterase [Candidatus Dojkabacteria bacterium]